MDQSKSLVPHTPAAVFLDYENIVYYLKQMYSHPPQLNNIVNGLLRSLEDHFKNVLQLSVVIFKAYADFERQVPALGPLYLMGIDSCHVLGKDHKNAADMRLCVDVMEVLYTRPEIQHYILISGDRDYIPVVQRLLRQGRQVKAVAFRRTLSADLLKMLGEENLIDAGHFINHYEQRQITAKGNGQLPPITLKILGKIDLPEDPRRARKTGTA
jgi:uncharacterized LabA/DUF88 family protein